jgi:hypothetical protein
MCTRSSRAVLILLIPTSTLQPLRHFALLEILIEVGHQEKCNEFSYTGQYTHKLESVCAGVYF